MSRAGQQALLNAVRHLESGQASAVQRLLADYEHALTREAGRRLLQALGGEPPEIDGLPGGMDVTASSCIVTENDARLRIQIQHARAGLFEFRGPSMPAIERYLSSESVTFSGAEPVEVLSLADLGGAPARGFELLGEVWPSVHDLARRTIRWLVLYEGVAGRTGSDPRAYGVVFATRGAYTHAEWCVTWSHETAHHLLHVLLVLGQLYEDDHERSLYSPFRGQRRPLVGVVHSAFALSRIVETCRRGANARRATDRNAFRGMEWRFSKTLGATLDVLGDVRWSEAGSLLMQICRRMASDSLAPPPAGPPEGTPPEPPLA
jgi:HEXXH motif-containing protein